MLEIDGSYGEGGGQILRSSLTLSLLTGKPFKLINIRAKRKKPGLMPQHLTCVKACKELSQAKTTGDSLGSTTLVFEPRTDPKAGRYFFDTGTAGATTLVFQTIFLPLSLAEGAEVILKGGTHVPYSPTYHYLEYVYVPMLASFGFKADLKLERAGFYPVGEGLIRAKILPAKDLKCSLFCEEPQDNGFQAFGLEKVLIISLISKDLPRHILERQAKSALEYLKSFSQISKLDELCEVRQEVVESSSPGTMCFVLLKGRSFRVGFSSLGARGLPAEEVGKSAAKLALEFLRKGAQVDPHLADQLVLPLAYLVYLGKATSISYTTSSITMHLITQAWLVPQFLEGLRISVNNLDDGKGVVRIERG
jgi:RNA 3'-phosphate cyclase